MKKLILCAGACTTLLGISAANAATYLYTTTGALSSTFTLSSTPTPDLVPNGNVFFVHVTGQSWNGDTSFGLEFLSAQLGGGVGICNAAFNYCSVLYGQQLFTGTTSAPVMSSGPFDLIVGTPYGDQHVALTVSEVGAAAVPEAATWSMMLAGFGLIGGAMRRRRTSISFA